MAAVDEAEIETNLAEWTRTVLGGESHESRAGADRRLRMVGVRERPPFAHVIYIIKENRTYDQIFGDLKKDGKPVGNGDASLAMYGAAITPNEHKLALQFGVLDNFLTPARFQATGMCGRRRRLARTIWRRPGSRTIAEASGI